MRIEDDESPRLLARHLIQRTVTGLPRVNFTGSKDYHIDITAFTGENRKLIVEHLHLDTTSEHEWLDSIQSSVTVSPQFSMHCKAFETQNKFEIYGHFEKIHFRPSSFLILSPFKIGKTSVSVALAHVVGFGDTQSDNISKKNPRRHSTEMWLISCMLYFYVVTLFFPHL